MEILGKRGVRANRLSKTVLWTAKSEEQRTRALDKAVRRAMRCAAKHERTDTEASEEGKDGSKSKRSLEKNEACQRGFSSSEESYGTDKNGRNKEGVTKNTELFSADALSQICPQGITSALRAG